jgi:hypothetical protein
MPPGLATLRAARAAAAAQAEGEGGSSSSSGGATREDEEGVEGGSIIEDRKTIESILDSWLPTRINIYEQSGGTSRPHQITFIYWLLFF